MKTYTCLLAFWLVAAPRVAAAVELPVQFARSGQKVTIALMRSDIQPSEPMRLTAFGRQLLVPLMMQDGTVEFIAPSVRVPVVFQLVTGPDAKVYYEGIVIYPDRPAEWEEDLQLVAAGCPLWLGQWSDAVKLPVTKFTDISALRAGNWRMPEKAGLLILGQKAAGNDLAVVSHLTAEYNINVLVLGSDWLRDNATTDREIALFPKYMRGPLVDLQIQKWFLPPIFHQHGVRILNRQTWIAGPDYPLVEEIRNRQTRTESLRMVFSYLPWQQQLGRTEVADELLLRLLAETAKGTEDRSPLDGRWRLLYPAAKDINADQRPVLAAAIKAEETHNGSESRPKAIRTYVLDLRGKTSPSEDFFANSVVIKALETNICDQSPLVILGDDPILDTWKWLTLDRSHHLSPRPGVIWCPDESLPPSINSQLRLMQLFTKWNISLKDISQEVKYEN